MDKNEKKKYEKPKITKIKLDPKTAVLAVCKASGIAGPGGSGCETFLGDPCSSFGS
jgi:hypothetical protein